MARTRQLREDGQKMDFSDDASLEAECGCLIRECTMGGRWDEALVSLLHEQDLRHYESESKPGLRAGPE